MGEKDRCGRTRVILRKLGFVEKCRPKLNSIKCQDREREKAPSYQCRVKQILVLVPATWDSVTAITTWLVAILG